MVQKAWKLIVQHLSYHNSDHHPILLVMEFDERKKERPKKNKVYRFKIVGSNSKIIRILLEIVVSRNGAPKPLILISK